jgi:hypothetical protein
MGRFDVIRMLAPLGPFCYTAERQYELRVKIIRKSV